jgi:probable HAF family extracellular repeat protein
MQDLGTLLGDSSSYAYGINNATSSHGVQVVGESDSASGQRRAFLWTQNGGMIPLGTLGGTSSSANGINDAGQGTGQAWLNGDSVIHAFLLTQGATDGVPGNRQMKDLGTLGGNFSSGHAINFGGQIAGESLPKSDTEHNGFRWAPSTPNGTTGKMTNLGTVNLGSSIKQSGAYGINDVGDVVGWTGEDMINSAHAFYWPGSGSMKDLNSLVPANTGFAWLDNAYGINHNGLIVGTGRLESPLGPYEHAVLLTPTSGSATAVQIGSFTASSNPVTSGSNLTLTASNITDANPGATITQVAFYYFDGSGTKHVLGDGTPSGTGAWTLTFTVNLGPGISTLYAQAQDSDGAFGDPATITLIVQ